MKFKTPRGVPGHTVFVSIRGVTEFSYKISLAGITQKFRPGGSVDFLDFRGRYESLFEPTHFQRRLWNLTNAVAEFQNQFTKGDYPYIYRERAEDLVSRDGKLLDIFREWERLTVHEQEQLTEQFGEPLAESVFQWQNLTNDLVAFSLNTAFSDPRSVASRVAGLMADDSTEDENLRQLDEAYNEYRKIYSRVYAPSKELKTHNQGVSR